MDPISFWMQGSVFWLRFFKQQQDAYLRILGQFAEKIPHEDAAALAREAESLKEVLNPTSEQAPPAKAASVKAEAPKANKAAELLAV